MDTDDTTKYGPGWLHNFLHNVFYDPLQMYTNSRQLQAVISGAGDSKFYRLPPDKENPASVTIGQLFSQSQLTPSHPEALPWWVKSSGGRQSKIIRGGFDRRESVIKRDRPS